MNAASALPIPRPNTRGFDFLTVGKPRCKIALEEYTVRIEGFPYFEIDGFAVLQATLDDDGIGFFCELVEVHAPIREAGKVPTRTLSNDADSSDELRLWAMIKASIEADEGMLEAVQAEFGFEDWRHPIEAAE